MSHDDLSSWLCIDILNLASHWCAAQLHGRCWWRSWTAPSPIHFLARSTSQETLFWYNLIGTCRATHHTRTYHNITYSYRIMSSRIIIWSYLIIFEIDTDSVLYTSPSGSCSLVRHSPFEGSRIIREPSKRHGCNISHLVRPGYR